MSRMGHPLFVPSSSNQRLSAGVVVRRFDGHRDVVRMALFETRRGDLHELSLLQVLDGRRTGVAHRRAQTAGELVAHRRQRASERYPALDSPRPPLVLAEPLTLADPVLVRLP